MPYHTMDPSQAIERILEAKGLSEEDDTDIMYQYTIFRRIRKEEKSASTQKQRVETPFFIGAAEEVTGVLQVLFEPNNIKKQSKD